MKKIKKWSKATEEITSLSVKIAEKLLGKNIDGHFDEKQLKN